MSLNQVTLIGRLGRDPEHDVTKSGLAVTTFSLATETWTKSGKVTTWHDIKCFGRHAMVAKDYLRKGREAGIVGYIEVSNYESDRYTDAEGKPAKMQKVRIVVTHLSLLGKKEEEDDSQNQVEGGSE